MSYSVSESSSLEKQVDAFRKRCFEKADSGTETLLPETMGSLRWKTKVKVAMYQERRKTSHFT